MRNSWLKLLLNAIVILFGIIAIVLILNTIGLSGGPRISINFVPIVFATLAIASLREALRASNARRALGGLHGFVWLLVIAAYMVFGYAGTFITLGIVASIFLGTFSRSIAGFLLNRKAPHHTSSSAPQATPYYQPSQQSPEETYHNYEQGYQPAENKEESNDVQSSLSGQYEQPQAEYPQQMPPQNNRRGSDPYDKSAWHCRSYHNGKKPVQMVS
jgi:hypothetical protein